MSISKYGRYWAVYDANDALICVTVYKRGAEEVVRRLQQALDDAQQWMDSNGPAEVLERDTPAPAIVDYRELELVVDEK